MHQQFGLRRGFFEPGFPVPNAPAILKILRTRTLKKDHRFTERDL
jgi:hypothetical protein